MNVPLDTSLNVPIEVWIAFNLFIVIMIILDLFVLHRTAKAIGIKSALVTSAIWIGIALLFNLGIYHFAGKEAALNFLAGYLIEKALSIDNLFVFVMLFKYFSTPTEYQYKVLFWGILGAIIMRAAMIFGGIALVNTFDWILYIFGFFLIYTGIRMAIHKSEEIHPEKNLILLLLKKWMPIAHNYFKDNFFVKLDQKWHATPLFVVLMMVETTDLIFALDSIPAVMAITLDPFIIYTSNIFAILGLRSLYFALSNLISMFHLLNYGLAAILTFVGIKMLLGNYYHIPIGYALGFIAVAIAGSIIASILIPDKKL